MRLIIYKSIFFPYTFLKSILCLIIYQTRHWYGFSYNIFVPNEHLVRLMRVHLKIFITDLFIHL